MERALRDKVAALNDLENAKLQIKRYDQEVSLVGYFSYLYKVYQSVDNQIMILMALSLLYTYICYTLLLPFKKLVLVLMLSKAWRNSQSKAV